MSLLAVDMGSSSCKAVAFREDGRVLAQSSRSYSPESSRPGFAEISPHNFWEAFLQVTHAVADQTGSDIAEALGISSHGETLIPVDGQQRPVARAILNIDNRAVAQAEWLAENPGRRSIFEITGLAVHPMYPLPKMLWLREHEPSIFSTTACFLALPSYLLSRLGLPAYVDYSLASRYLAFDIRQRRWSEELLAPLRLEPARFPQPVQAGTIAGQLSPEVATQLGVPAGTPVVVGGHDQPCAALGCGVSSPGRVSASLGTYECLLAVSEVPALNHHALAANLNSYCHVVPDKFVTIAYFPAGIMIEWLLHLLYPDEQLASSESVSRIFQELESKARDGPTNLLVTPHLLGSCNPDFNPHASGVVLGIRPGTTRSDLYKAVLEGIACEFATMAALLQQVVGPFESVYVAGGGARSALGLELRAALASRRLEVMRASEAVCLGTAILAGVAIGKYTGIYEAVQHLAAVTETVEPSPEIAAQYTHQLEQYRLLYSSLAPIRKVQAQPSFGGTQ